MNSHLPSPLSSSPETSISSPSSPTKLSRNSSKRRRYNNSNNNESSISNATLSITSLSLSVPNLNHNNLNLNIPTFTSTSTNQAGISLTTPPPDSPHPNSIQPPSYCRRPSTIALPALPSEQDRRNDFISERFSIESLSASRGVPSNIVAGGLVGGRREMQGEKMERGNIIEKKNMGTSGGISTGGVGLPLRRSHDESMIGRNTREVGNRDQFVQALVGASVLAIESIWGTIAPESCSLASTLPSPSNEATAFPLRWFVTEVLRRSRTSCSTLQVALYYLHKVRKQIRDVVTKATHEAKASERNIRLSQREVYPSPPLTPVDIESMDYDSSSSSSSSSASSSSHESSSSKTSEISSSPILCGRRMFLASLIAASKFLQDRNFSNRAWAKISGLSVVEINTNERAFLGLMDFKLFLSSSEFTKWTDRLAALAVQSSLVARRASPPPSLSTNSSSLSNTSTVQSSTTITDTGSFNFTATGNALALDLSSTNLTATLAALEVEEDSIPRPMKGIPSSSRPSSLHSLSLTTVINPISCPSIINSSFDIANSTNLSSSSSNVVVKSSSEELLNSITVISQQQNNSWEIVADVSGLMQVLAK